MSDGSNENNSNEVSYEDLMFKLDFQDRIKQQTDTDFEFDSKDISKVKDIFIKNNKDLDLDDFEAVLNTYNQYNESLKNVVEDNKDPEVTNEGKEPVAHEDEKKKSSIDDDEFDFENFNDDYKFSTVEEKVVEPPKEDEVTRLKRELQAELDELKEIKKQLSSDKKTKEEPVEEPKVESKKEPKVEDIEEFTEADLDVFIKSLVDVEPEKAAAAFKKKLKAESDKAKKLEEKLSKLEEQINPDLLDSRVLGLLEKRKQEEEQKRLEAENERLLKVITKSRDDFLKTKEAKFVLKSEEDLAIYESFLVNNQKKMMENGEDLSKLHEKTFISLMNYKKKIRGASNTPKVEAPSTPTATDVQGGGFSSQKTPSMDLEKEFGIVSNKKLKYI